MIQTTSYYSDKTQDSSQVLVRYRNIELLVNHQR